MSTQFFENQEAARRQSSRLIFLFGCALVGMVALLYVLAVALSGASETDAYGRVVSTGLDFWQPDLLVQVSLATLAVVSAGSLYKILQLKAGGGTVVAESLGGQLLATDTADPTARKILNVVEEMAIASGTPTPPVYLLAEETGINAFAAGFTPSDAVIAVTRGCIELLSRDELQGVVAHEFSHILNGDMRLNIRLMGAVHGILLIGIIGYFLLRSSMFAGGRRDSRDNSRMFILVAGFGLVIVGFVGTFFGNLIKASISRQHEFLADASAVQFTRNPDGIAGALKKIAGLAQGSILISPSAPLASHLFFSQGLSGGLQSIFATHPPLEERIKRLDPSFVGSLSATSEREGRRQPAAVAGFGGGGAGTHAARQAAPLYPTASAIEHIGEPRAAHIDYAARLLASLPQSVITACREPHAARAILYALLMNRDEATRKRQLDLLVRSSEPGIADETRALLTAVDRLDSRARLPLVDIALPALRRLSATQFAAFKSDTAALVEADGRMDLFEWTLQRILFAHLSGHFERDASRAGKRFPLSRFTNECGVVLTMLARSGSVGEGAVRDAFRQGAAELGGITPALLPTERATLSLLDQALESLAQADASAIRQLISACAACVAADGLVSEAQGELIRAIADCLGAPMPPLLPGQRLA